MKWCTVKEKILLVSYWNVTFKIARLDTIFDFWAVCALLTHSASWRYVHTFHGPGDRKIHNTDQIRKSPWQMTVFSAPTVHTKTWACKGLCINELHLYQLIRHEGACTDSMGIALGRLSQEVPVLYSSFSTERYSCCGRNGWVASQASMHSFFLSNRNQIFHLSLFL